MDLEPVVEIVCDGNERIGLGHIRRSQTLARQLSQDGVSVRLRGLSSVAMALLPPRAHQNAAPRILVVDVPSAPADLVAEARQSGQTLVGLDWFGEDEVDVNVVVYPHQTVHARLATYVGLQFVMIRHDVTRWGRLPLPEAGKRVAIVLGGGDLLGQGHLAADCLAAAGLDVVLVQGPLAADHQGQGNYEVEVNPTDLPALLAACDWTVTNGGTCMFESLCMGKPPYVLPQTDAERRVSASIASHGAVLGSGLSDLRAFNIESLRDVAAKGQGLIDGAGAERISRIVRGLL